MRKALTMLLEDRAAEPFSPQPADPFPAGAHPTDYRRSGLGGFGKAMARCVAEALLCDEDEARTLVPPDAETLERVVRKLDLWLGSASPEVSRGFGALCAALESAPMWLLRKPARFRALPLADRIHLLEKLEDHDNGLFAMLVTAFKVPLATAAFEEGPLLAETGFDRQNLSVRRGPR